MLSSFLSRILPSNLTRKPLNEEQPKREKNSNPLEILEHSILDAKGSFFSNFNLFHHDTRITIDILIFLPHYGLYFGEKISWQAEELKGASVERSSRQKKKEPSTKLESTEHALHQKLEDVLSFDSTAIERFFWLEYLSEDEFDALDSSFHKLLPKERLIFSDDDILIIQEKLQALGHYHEEPYSHLKVLGSLNAHTLLLPTVYEPFGALLSDEQQLFLKVPLENKPYHLLGQEGSGKTTVLIRKVLQTLLENETSKISIITPTLISGEIFRRELIALGDFAVVHVDFNRINFIHPTSDELISNKDIPLDTTLIVFDDYPINDHIDTVGKSIIISSTSLNTDHASSYSLEASYRSPSIKSIHFSHTKGALFTILANLRELFEQKSNTPILIILPNEEHILQYKHAIDEYLHIDSCILSSSFSLQYKNLDPITLSTPTYIVGLSVPHSFIVNLDSNAATYPLALSRASESTTIISEEI